MRRRYGPAGTGSRRFSGRCKRHRLPLAEVNGDVYFVKSSHCERGPDGREDDLMVKDIEIEGKKLEIVKYAFDRFYEGGFHATGMETALAGSGISKRTIYKYFPSKEDLIEAVLLLYSMVIVHELFDPVANINDPREQIVAFFDVRKTTGRVLTRGCLGMKAAQEYAGKHDRIVELGVNASSRGEAKFLELCERAGFQQPARLAKQLNLILQGALVLSHASGNTSPFLLAKDAASVLLEKAVMAGRKSARSRH
jgi:AcrR family transcriptional regulator